MRRGRRRQDRERLGEPDRRSGERRERDLRSRNAMKAALIPWKIAMPSRAGARIERWTTAIVSSTRRAASVNRRSARSTCAVASAAARFASADIAWRLATIGRTSFSNRLKRVAHVTHGPHRHHQRHDLPDRHRQDGQGDQPEKDLRRWGHASCPVSRVWNWSRARSNAVVRLSRCLLRISRP